MLDYVAIGHIAQDLTPSGVRLGGTVSYAALTAKALGQRTGLVTAAARGAVTTGLEAVEVCRVLSAASTVFENVYTPAGRVQTLHSRADRLSLAAVPAEWRTAGIIHLAPIADEVDPALASQFPGSFVGLTPQGWMRRWDGDGRVYYSEWTEAAAGLAAASAAVISIEDVEGDWALAERWAAAARVLAVTEGARGATVFAAGERQHFPAPTVTVVDGTGAGDIFAAAFFVRLHHGGDPAEAAQFAIALATDSVTRVGIAGVPGTLSSK